MSRYLLIAMGVIAISACNDDRADDRNSRDSTLAPAGEVNETHNSNSSSRNGRGSTPSGDSETPKGMPFQTGQNGSGMNDQGSYGAKSTDRTGGSTISDDRPDRTNSTLTAGDQSESEADRSITQQIRKAVVADSTLSTKAKNCTIVTIGGVVTLRGSVDTEVERLAIGSKADGVSGVRRVQNNLKIAQ